MRTRDISPCVLVFMMIAAAACSATAKTESTSLNLEETCAMKIDFSNPDSVSPWQIVNDGVMGGLSQGARFAEDGHMVFRGIINTNGGGFSSLRRRMEPGDLANTSGLKLKVRSDGRDYKLTFRTSERWRGRSVSYQASIPTTAADAWAEVTVPFTDMRTSVFGRTVRAAPFDPSDVREMGIILADGVDGPFKLDVQSVSCAADTTQEI
jgi:NADH dehydrogenase [ubiquinone] 1 alpha subcomplex assembly factor 1